MKIAMILALVAPLLAHAGDPRYELPPISTLVPPNSRPDTTPCPYDHRVWTSSPACSILHYRYLENHGGWQYANPLCTPGVDEECTGK